MVSWGAACPLDCDGCGNQQPVIEVAATMTELLDASIAALRANHDQLERRWAG